MALNNSNATFQWFGGTCEAVNVTAEKILYAVFITLIMTTSVVGNLFVVMAVCLSNSLKKRVTFYFIASLACSDFLFAIFQLPFRISSHMNDYKFCATMPACYVMIISDSTVNVASILNLLLIALDRFIAIKYPFRYNEVLTTSNSKKLIAGVWCFSLFWSFIGIFRWDRKGDVYGININPMCGNNNFYYYAVSSFGIYIPVLIFIVCTYLTILHVAIQQIRAIEANNVSMKVDTQLLTASSGQNSPNLNEKIRKRRKRKLNRELHATKSVVIVYLAYVICWLPFQVINVIILIDNKHFPEMNRKNHKLFLFIYYTFIEILPALNTMINPFIYSFSNRQFREAFKLLLSKALGNKLFMIKHDDFVHSVDLSSVPCSPAVSPRGKRL